MDWNRFTSISCSTLEKLRDDRARLLAVARKLDDHFSGGIGKPGDARDIEGRQLRRELQAAIAKAEA